MNLQLLLFKKCTKCNIDKSSTEFHKSKSKDGLKSLCKECSNKDRLKYPGSWYDSKVKSRKFIWEYKKSHPCIKCGEKDPIVLIFDHIDRTTKTSNIADMQLNHKEELLKTEIDKCRILCSNCHAKVTAEQFGWYKDFLDKAEET